MTAKYISSASNLSPNDVWDKMTIGAWSFDDLCMGYRKERLRVSQFYRKRIMARYCKRLI